jgi:hypothetical protein
MRDRESHFRPFYQSLDADNGTPFAQLLQAVGGTRSYVDPLDRLACINSYINAMNGYANRATQKKRPLACVHSADFWKWSVVRI